MRTGHRPDRIEFDIPIAAEDVFLVLGEAGSESPFPEGAAAAIDAIDILDVALAQVLHQQGGAISLLGGQQKMDMVGHEHVGMDGAAIFPGHITQCLEISYVVFVGVKTRGPIVSALDHVPRYPRNREPGPSRHLITPALPFPKAGF